MTIYTVIDRLHPRRVVRVPGDGIAATVSAWLAELEAQSPLVDDLARAVAASNWPRAYALANTLSVSVEIATVA
ncbi:hypothetical protein NWT09_28330 [Mycolicibacterium sp. jd]|uniref:Uncharacterized protein n=2 Tax=Mycobacteriaceae TaxID=1762 RepID=A0A1Y0CHP2_9MYCO|nr:MULTISPECIES: hypothetical protein [Mycobacteriaceae]ART74554.1 hypothetical protein BTO20_38895 [Mycobacterium dioxanotrophicus]MDN4521839.1 hypothetical protein [Mycolicibacterium austroafricanum]UJL30588.1 hypothetical protein HZU38_09175 [Mycolicibacterium vanbaalenii]WND56306.1 hypothetical protein QQA43_27160 [Mycolicibacterium vanbaalenii]